MARYRLELGPIPLHHQVYLDLKAALDAGEWAAGDRLPTERDLAFRYGCSLITIRRALGELVRESRLERTRGRGTFVLAQRMDVDFAGTLSFTEEMQTRGLDPQTRLIAARPEAAGEAVATALGLELGSPTLYLERLRLADGEPLLLEQVHLPAERFPGLLDHSLRDSIYALMQTDYGVVPREAIERIEIVGASATAARLLDVPRSSPLLSVVRVMMDDAGRPFELSHDLFRGDRVRVVVRGVADSDTPGVIARSIQTMNLPCANAKGTA